MIEGHGVILERCIRVGHGGMPGVAGFGEQAQIGESKTADHLSFEFQVRPSSRLPQLRMHPQQRQDAKVDQYVYRKDTDLLPAINRDSAPPLA